MSILFLVLLLLPQLFLVWKFPKPPIFLFEHYDACIVLGCPTKPDGSISRMQKSRMNKAIELYHRGYVHTIIISGAGVRNAYVEADVMALYSYQHGVAKNHVMLEKQARNTYDNLRCTLALCKEQQLSSVIVVTSRFHIRRSAFFVKKFFDTYVMCPTDDKEKFKHYLAEYLRMWNTLRIEYRIKYRKGSFFK